MACCNLDEAEDRIQKPFDDLKIDFKKNVVLSVTILQVRDISVSFVRDKLVDTPDPQFVVTCPKLSTKNRFQTVTKSSCRSCDINETFKFIIPDSLLNESFPVEFKLSDDDIIFDDFLGKVSVDVGDLPIEETIEKTMKFGQHGEVDVRFNKHYRNTPDFRLSLGLNDKEKEFRKKRIPKVCKHLQEILEESKAPKSEVETPVVSLACSGGGYRAVIGMCGAMEALKDHDLLDSLTYACGLSGSAWYLSTSYARKGMKKEEQGELHDHIRKSLSHNFLTDFVNPVFLARYKKYISKKTKFCQPCSFVDLFGFGIGENLMGKENMDVCLSDLQPYVENAEVPYPVFVSLHVKNTIRAAKYHACMELTPYEVNLPTYGVGMSPQTSGSVWSSGIVARGCPEHTLHFIQGMCGCAFAVLFKVYAENGGEESEEFSQFIDEVRTRGRKSKSQNPVEGGTEIEIDSDASGDTDEEPDVDEKVDIAVKKKDEKDQQKQSPKGLWKRLLSLFMNLLGWNEAEKDTSDPEGDGDSKLFEDMKKYTFFTSRDEVIGRTAKIFNVVQGIENVKSYTLNPIAGPVTHTEQQNELIEKVYIETGRKISTRKDILSVVDAGVLINVPTDVALRPQRNPDVLIIFDFTGYKSDDSFDYMPLMTAAAHAWIHGLKFPSISFGELTKLPPKPFLIFESEDIDCPTVLWFSLCNKEFKKTKLPKYDKKYPEVQNFTDFPVYGKDGGYSTFKFRYSDLKFDRLRELMYFNVSSHIEEIKEAIAKAVERRRKRFAH